MTMTAAQQPTILSLEDREDSNYPDLIFPSMIFINIPSISLPFTLGQNCLESKCRFLSAATNLSVQPLYARKSSSGLTFLSDLPECRHHLSQGFPCGGAQNWRAGKQWVSLSKHTVSSESQGYLSGFCVHTCICKRIRWVKVLKHCPHFQRCQSLNSEWSWLVEVGLARTRWFFTLI